MKPIKATWIAGFLVLSVCLTACGSGQKENPYSLDALGDDDAYAFLEMDYQYDVMVVSDMLYDSGTERQAAVSCDVYYCIQGRTVNLGTISGDGTAYPITFLSDGIFAASGNKIEKYAVSEKDGGLYLKQASYIQYDENGKEHYTAVTDGTEAESTEAEYQTLAEEYAKSQTVHFSYGADGSVNQLE